MANILEVRSIASDAFVAAVPVGNFGTQTTVNWRDPVWEPKALKGYFLTDEGIVIGSGIPSSNFPLKVWSLNEFAAISGEWIAVLHNKKNKQWVLLQDTFGNSSGYFSVIGYGEHRKLLFADSFNSLVGCVNSFHGSVSPNYAALLPPLITFTNLFRTRVSYQSFAKGIDILGHENYILIGEGGWGVQKKPSTLALAKMTYDQLIDKGINDAVNELKLLARQDYPVSLALSGGKDSRMLLALIVAAGLTNEISINTNDGRKVPPGATRDINLKDLHLATRLHDALGLKWREALPLGLRRISPEDAINNFQRFRSNNSFEFVPTMTVADEGTPFVNLLGIGGELIRSYIGQGYVKSFPVWWDKAGGTEKTLSCDLQELFRVLVNPDGIEPGFFEEASHHFVAQIGSFSAQGNVLTALDAQYQEFRSRAHTGNRHFGLLNGGFTFTPLSQLAFIEAGKLLEQEERDNGRVMFEIFKRTCPDLLSLPFASPPWPESFLAELGPSGINWNSFDGGKGLAAYDAQNHYNASKVRWLPSETKTVDLNRYWRERVSQNVSELLDLLDPRLVTYRNSTFVDRIALNSFKNPGAVLNFIGKTESALDIFRDTDFRMVSFDSAGDFRIHRIRLEDASAKRESSIDFAQKASEVSFAKTELSIEARGDDVEVQIAPLPVGSKVAVYWYEDGEIHQRDPYEVSQNFLYKATSSAVGSIRAQVFLKWDHLSEASRIESLEINFQDNG